MSTKSSWILDLELERCNVTWRIHVSPCGRYLVGEGKGSPDLWVLSSPDYSHNLGTTEGTYWGGRTLFIAFTPDGEKCFTYRGSKFTGWQSASGKPFWEVDVERRIEACHLLASGNKLAIHCSEDRYGSVAIFDIATKKQCFSYGPEQNLEHAAFSPCGNHAIIGKEEEQTFFDFKTDRRTPFKQAGRIGFAPNGRSILVQFYNERFELLNVDNFETAVAFPLIKLNHCANPGPMPFSSDGVHLFFHGTDHDIWALNTSSGRIEAKFPHKNPATFFMIEPSGDRLWSYSWSDSRYTAHYWNYINQSIISEYENIDSCYRFPQFDKSSGLITAPRLREPFLDILDYETGQFLGDVRIDSEFCGPAPIMPGRKKFAAIISQYRIGVCIPPTGQDLAT